MEEKDSERQWEENKGMQTNPDLFSTDRPSFCPRHKNPIHHLFGLIMITALDCTVRAIAPCSGRR